MPQTILLTGATGYIATHIAQQLLHSGHTVRASARSEAKGAAQRDTLERAGADISRLTMSCWILRRIRAGALLRRAWMPSCKRPRPFRWSSPKTRWR